jgi:Ornithine decarboxylase antizyme
LRTGGAAYTITEESERLFCETLRAVFLGEGNLAYQDSLVTGVQNDQQLLQGHSDYGCDVRSSGSGSMAGYENRIRGLPFPEVDGFVERRGLVTQWVEIWDYVGGARFRGFVAEKEDGERAMFVFFDDGVVGSDLKPG